ncbi:glycoside hydrolase [Halosquirtibacter laminarini]|uniref:Glycoside hydrolase n=1 Tax=Halosquirtibacter laminarini TaxID=3374600 RepID=A0AC61NFD2_9BACT|nr:glycoside hydrolase [Prolixibacteraceae bacterium]
MRSRNTFKIIGLLAFALLYSCKTSTEPIYAPTPVASAPANAFQGLIKLKSGEIRYYALVGDDDLGKFYMRSLDQGLTWDTIRYTGTKLFGRQNPKTGTFIRVARGTATNGEVVVQRATNGIDGAWTQTAIDTSEAIMIKPALFIKNGERIIVPYHTYHHTGAAVYYSDDDGISWKSSNAVQAPPHKKGGIHKGVRWNHGAVEPSVVELKDGTLWMLMRTAQDYLYQSFSKDGGTTWSEATASPFHSTITMPTFLKLKDGRILLFWNNTAPLPETDHPTTGWEDVFTNRDALHLAITEDGKKWTGFRELYLNPARNAFDFPLRGGKLGSNDRSVQQTEAIELEHNKVLVSLGQHPYFRKILLFDTNWLYEKERTASITPCLEQWTVHQYFKGIVGHCAYRRTAGAHITPSPLQSNIPTLHFQYIPDNLLLDSHQGAAWNFPAMEEGEISLDIYLSKDFKGAAISLTDHWYNATDSTVVAQAPYPITIDSEGKLLEKFHLKKQHWNHVKVVWSKKNQQADLYVNRNKVGSLKQRAKVWGGISYIHFLSIAQTIDREGFYIRNIKAKTLQ